MTSQKAAALAARLDRYLASTGITQAEFAETAQVSQSTVSRILKGAATSLRRSTIRRVERVIGITAPTGLPTDAEHEPALTDDRRREFRIWAAGPSDVAEEITVLREVVDELNHSGLRFLFHVVNWMTDATPGLGSDGQAVINQTMPREYDLFLGVMWGRIGTATGRAPSGTLEEFQNAYSRWQQDPSKVDVLFYFKDAPIAPSEMNLEQLQGVQTFRADLADKGLYATFRSTDELARHLRLNLPGRARAMLTTREIAATTPPVSGVSQDESDDDGILDLQDDAQEAFLRTVETLTRITNETSSLGSKVEARAVEMAAVPRKHGESDIKAMRRLCDRAAEDMNAFVDRLEAELPLLSEAQSTGFDKTARAVALFIDLEADDDEALGPMRESTTVLARTAREVRQEIVGFRNAVNEVPRLTKSLAKARRRSAAIIDQLIIEFESTERMADAVIQAIDAAEEEMASRNAGTPRDSS